MIKKAHRSLLRLWKTDPTASASGLHYRYAGPFLGQQHLSSLSRAWFVTVLVASVISTQDTEQLISFLFLTDISVLLKAPVRGQAPCTQGQQGRILDRSFA